MEFSKDINDEGTEIDMQSLKNENKNIETGTYGGERNFFSGPEGR